MCSMTVPNQLAVAYDARLLQTIAEPVASAIGRKHITEG